MDKHPQSQDFLHASKAPHSCGRATTGSRQLLQHCVGVSNKGATTTPEHEETAGERQTEEATKIAEATQAIAKRGGGTRHNWRGRRKMRRQGGAAEREEREERKKESDEERDR